METVAVEPWSDALAAGVLTFPDFVVHRLALSGIGRVDAEWPGSGQPAAVRLVPRSGGEPSELARWDVGGFRSVAACWARRFGVANPYCGHSLFAAEPHPGWPHQRLHRFSLFLCNEPAMGLWFRVYLYCIDGVWPMAEWHAEPGAAPDPARM